MCVIHICLFSHSSGSVSTQCHEGATCNTCHTDSTQIQTHTCSDRKVMRAGVGNQCTHSHFLSFIFSLIHTSFHPASLFFSNASVHTTSRTQTFTNTAKSFELASEVPIAFLIRIAVGRVSSRRLCELKCMRLDIKLFVSSPVWSKSYSTLCKLTCSVICGALQAQTSSALKVYCLLSVSSVYHRV